MKFNIFFTIKGSAGVVKDVPNKFNPVDCANLEDVLWLLSDKLPNNQALGVETVGVRIELAETTDMAQTPR